MKNPVKIKKTVRPYLAIVDGMQLGFFKTQEAAFEAAYRYRTNFSRSQGEEILFLPIKIVYDQSGEPQRTVHEE